MITTEPETITRVRWSSDRDDDRFTVHDPSTGDPITVVQGGGVPEADAAVRAGHEAFEQWRWLTAAQRVRYLLACSGATCTATPPDLWVRRGTQLRAQLPVRLMPVEPRTSDGT